MGRRRGGLVRERHDHHCRRWALGAHGCGRSPWTCDSRDRERPQPRLPSRAPKPHPRARRLVLDVAGPHVRGRPQAHTGQLLRARRRGLRRDAGGRLHRGRRIPLPASSGRRHPVFGTEHDGSEGGRSRRRRRDSNHSARHPLSPWRSRCRRLPPTVGEPTPLQRPDGRPLPGTHNPAQPRRPVQGRYRHPLDPGGRP